MKTGQSRLGAARLRAIGAGMLLAAATATQATPVINLGAAGDYSGFFFGNLTAHSDVEGRLAVRGNVDINSISVGYRNPSPRGSEGSNAASLVVGGNVKIRDGAIYNGPTDPKVNSNAGMGPSEAGMAVGSRAARHGRLWRHRPRLEQAPTVEQRRSGGNPADVH